MIRLTSCDLALTTPRIGAISLGFCRLIGLWHDGIFAAALFIFIWPVSPVLGGEALYSRTAGPTCQHFSEGPFIETHCKGPAGYAAVIIDRDRVISINYGRLSGGRLDRGPEGSDLRWRGAARLIDDRIEWRLLRGQPFAAIIRIFTLTEDDRPLQQFLIAKVTPSGSCEVARISVVASNAHGTARDIADSQAPMIECEFEARR